MTKQEMFDRAWNGLAGQGWAKAYSYTDEACVYRQVLSDGSVRRCAWGHVDPEGTSGGFITSVRTLHERGIGLAGQLGFDEVLFAQELQNTHDEANGPDGMKQAFIEFAEDHGLKVPE